MNLASLLKREQLGVSQSRSCAKDLALPGLRFRPEKLDRAVSLSSQALLTPASSSSHSAGPVSFFVPTLAALADQIQQHLAQEPKKILQLNPTRREAICKHLEQISGQALTAVSGHDRLRTWIENSSAPESCPALSQFWREVALFCLAESIVLKAWSDRGARRWKKEDLQDLNASFHSALKSHIPLDREGWQFTRPNLYSWFKLPAEIQDAIWREFLNWKIVDEGPELLMTILQKLRENAANGKATYDEPLYRALWRRLDSQPTEALNSSEAPRKRSSFSPTLREGTVVRSGSRQLDWYGLEQDAFSLFLAELTLIWWGPTSPPYWSAGNGLEVLSREQLSLGLGVTSKPSVQQKLSDMEAFDFAWVAEETILRGGGRSVASTLFRESVDQNPLLKRIRSGGTSLGHLQACVALSKLRPGGKLCWLREQALHASDGSEALQFLLDRGKLIAEWDLSGLQSQFPSAPHTLSLPGAMYLWARETDLQSRHDHQPLRVRVKGLLKSHVELERLLEDLLAALDTGEGPAVSRPNWQIYVQKSPQSQRAWADRWPELLQEESLDRLERMRRTSQPLASIATIRLLEASSTKTHSLTGPFGGIATGFIVRQSQSASGRRLSCHRIQRGIALPSAGGPETGPAFFVALGDENLSAPIRAYLESEAVAFWLDQKTEVRANRWVLKEQEMKSIPVPTHLASARILAPLPQSWELMTSMLASQPQLTLQALHEDFIRSESSEDRAIHLELFLRASRIRDDLRASQNKMAEWVDESGRIRWTQLLQKCESCELGPITLHPEIAIQAGSGGLPLQTPLLRKTRSTQGQWIMTLSTEMGATITLKFARRLIFEMISEQIESMENPTWSEVVEFVRAPRRPEMLESRASSVLRSHGEASLVLAELDKVVHTTLLAVLR